MTKGTIYLDTKQIDRLVKELKGFESELSEATYAALTRTMDHVKAKTAQLVSKEYSVKSSFVKSLYKPDGKSSGNRIRNMGLLIVGRTLTLARFPHSPMKPRKGKYAVKVAIKRGEGRKAITTKPLPFIASTGAKSEGKIQYNVFVRLGKKRLPIKPLYTLSVPQMVTIKKVVDQIQEAANNKLSERLEHEIIYRMTKIKIPKR